MTVHRTLLPPGWPQPRGYANGIAASGRFVFTGGVVGWDEQEKFVSGTLPGQFRQVLVNTLAILAQGGAGPEHVVRMTWYVTSRDDYVAGLKEIGGAWRELMGRNFPAMAVVEVSALVEPAAKVEIETTAMVPQL
jgi:enamine deaminase RidA (YjgF/YER057c/UK114 family)